MLKILKFFILIPVFIFVFIYLGFTGYKMNDSATKLVNWRSDKN